MPQLRLVIVTPRFWPLMDDLAMHVLGLAKSLVAAGHHLRVVTPQWSSSWPSQMIVDGVEVVRLRGSLKSGWSTLRWMYALRTWLRQAAPTGLDVVLAFGLRHEAFVALGHAKTAGTRVVMVAGEGDLDWQRTATFGRRVSARCRSAPAIISPSQSLAEALIAAGYSHSRIAIVPRRVSIPAPRSPQWRGAARAALAAVNCDLVTTEATLVALAVGRLDAGHRFDDLVRAWRMVSARRSNARLWIIGDGPQRETLYRQISDLDQRFRVLIPGTFDGWGELFQAADVFLSPGAHQVVPLATLSAQAAGLPILAAAAGALGTHVQQSQCGVLHPLGESKMLADRLVELMNEPATGVLLGARGRELMQQEPTPADEAAAYLCWAQGGRLKTEHPA